MATFYVIRFRRTFMASDRFAHIAKGSTGDYVLTQEGCYRGATRKIYNTTFENAKVMTAKEAQKEVAGFSFDYPADIYEVLPVTVQEPVR